MASTNCFPAGERTVLMKSKWFYAVNSERSTAKSMKSENYKFEHAGVQVGASCGSTSSLRTNGVPGMPSDGTGVALAAKGINSLGVGGIVAVLPFQLAW